MFLLRPIPKEPKSCKYYTVCPFSDCEVKFLEIVVFVLPDRPTLGFHNNDYMLLHRLFVTESYKLGL